MAVTLTKNFYISGAWHEPSKVVFTSPNMDSPSPAGTRSHTYPGRVDIATWYEDSSNMYRFFTAQQEDSIVYFDGLNYVAQSDITGSNTIVFKVTFGTAYDCRLTAWDDYTHSSTTSELLSTDRCRATAFAFYMVNTVSSLAVLNLIAEEDLVVIKTPVINKILKGNVNFGGEDYFYGDFTMNYRFDTNEKGDYLIFKPMLYNITEDVNAGTHNFVIAFHYSYT